MEYIYNHTQLPASVIITAEAESEANNILLMINSQGFNNWRLDQMIDDEGNLTDFDEHGNAYEAPESEG